MNRIQTDVVVLGAGPGGYAAAFYAADLGKKVVLVDKDTRLGGVCLNRGCIPSKALLHAAKLLHHAKEGKEMGIIFDEPKIHLNQLREWKTEILNKLAGGISGLAKKRRVEVVSGRGLFESSNTLRVETEEGQKFIQFQTAIIAVGSRPAMPASFDLGNPKIMTSTEALELEEIPEKLLVVGGGYIGMELGTVYAALGSQIHLVEALSTILAGADTDLVRPVSQLAEKIFSSIRLQTKVLKMATKGKQIQVTLEQDSEKSDELYDRVLVSIGRVPNTNDIGLENTKVTIDEKGFVNVNLEQQTDDPSIFAIGDVAGGVLLAHKAAKEARIAVEAILGEAVENKDIIIPAVVFTDPEVAWCGLTEAEAKEKGIDVEIAKFPWGASGRALTLNRTDGLTKLIVDPQTERILGVGLVGVGAGDMISEGVLAIEMGATVRDIALTVHPHPTLSETIFEAAEHFYGVCSHAYSPKKRILEEAITK